MLARRPPGTRAFSPVLFFATNRSLHYFVAWLCTGLTALRHVSVLSNPSLDRKSSISMVKANTLGNLGACQTLRICQSIMVLSRITYSFSFSWGTIDQWPYEIGLYRVPSSKGNSVAIMLYRCSLACEAGRSMKHR